MLLIGSLVAFFLLARYAIRYGKDWQPPASMAHANWTMRHRLGLTLGATAVAVTALCSAYFFQDWLARVALVGQAVFLANSGASDIRKFQLPLPLTLGGIILAFITASALRLSWTVIVFGMSWAVVLILVYALLTKRAMAVGDYIAAVWIGVAAPYNGLFAILVGDIANFVYIKMNAQDKDKKAKVAAAGAWLLIAAAMVALPPFFNYLGLAGNTIKLADSTVYSVLVAQDSGVEAQKKAATATEPIDVVDVTYALQRQAFLVAMAKNASDATAQIAFVTSRADRVNKARQTAQEIAKYRALAQRLNASPDFVAALDQLSQSLAQYNTDGVRAASLALALVREEMQAELSAISVQTSHTQN
jgi:hypothetical protein